MRLHLNVRVLYKLVMHARFSASALRRCAFADFVSAILITHGKVGSSAGFVTVTLLLRPTTGMSVNRCQPAMHQVQRNDVLPFREAARRLQLGCGAFK